jgi:hypothetical protein
MMQADRQHTMKLLSLIVCLAVFGLTGCKKIDPAQTALPGRRMAEAEVLSLATTVFAPGPEQSQYHVDFKDGVWMVACESNHILRTVMIRDSDGVIMQTNQP